MKDLVLEARHLALDIADGSRSHPPPDSGVGVRPPAEFEHMRMQVEMKVLAAFKAKAFQAPFHQLFREIARSVIWPPPAAREDVNRSRHLMGLYQNVDVAHRTELHLL